MTPPPLRLPRVHTMPLLLSLDGNIGSGKSTLLAALAAALPTVECVPEPVAEWMRIKNADGKSLLELFYEDHRRWAYTFQNCAVLTRLRGLRDVIAATTKDVVITERSVLTDRFVFAEMLRASGDIDAMEFELYMQWFNTFAVTAVPVRGIVYLTTGADVCAERIAHRAREGEHMSRDYLNALDAQHRGWLGVGLEHGGTDLPILEVADNEPFEQVVTRLKAFVAVLTVKPTPLSQ